MDYIYDVHTAAGAFADRLKIGQNFKLFLSVFLIIQLIRTPVFATSNIRRLLKHNKWRIQNELQ